MLLCWVLICMYVCMKLGWDRRTRTRLRRMAVRAWHQTTFGFNVVRSYDEGIIDLTGKRLFLADEGQFGGFAGTSTAAARASDRATVHAWCEEQRLVGDMLMIAADPERR